MHMLIKPKPDCLSAKDMSIIFRKRDLIKKSLPSVMQMSVLNILHKHGKSETAEVAMRITASEAGTRAALESCNAGGWLEKTRVRIGKGFGYMYEIRDEILLEIGDQK